MLIIFLSQKELIDSPDSFYDPQDLLYNVMGYKIRSVIF